MPLTEEAKSLIKEELEVLTREQSKTLQELAIYKWGLRALFAVLFGGSILGVLKFQDYLDSRIAARTEQLEDVYFGIVQLSSNQAPEAVLSFDRALSSFSSLLLKPTETFRSDFFYYFILALADSYEQNPDGSWTGKPAWDRLRSNDMFLRDESRNMAKWRNNEFFSNAWARCILKYGKGDDVVREAQGWYQKAEKLSAGTRWQGSNLFGLAMIDILDNQYDEAGKKLRAAEESDPKDHAIKNYTLNTKIDLGDEAPMWFALSRTRKVDFENGYKKVIAALKRK